MRYVQDEIVEEHVEECWFNRNGEELSNPNEQFYAKSVTKTGDPVYYVREHAGALFNPEGMYARKNFKPDEIKMRRVAKKVFDLYMLFLQTKNPVYLTKAQRGQTNG